MDEGLKVTYNGGVDSFYPCTKPTDLVVGQTYTVVSSVKRTTNLQKDYILEGISGQFCSEWFDVISTSVEPSTKDSSKSSSTTIPHSIAYTHNIPALKQPCNLYNLSKVNGQWKISRFSITFDKIQPVGGNVYRCIVAKHVYYIEVIEP